MMTENGGIAEVTEAAERMATIPPLSRENKSFKHTERRVSQRKSTEAYWQLFFSVVFLYVPLCSLW
jgi:hypothetical protein